MFHGPPSAMMKCATALCRERDRQRETDREREIQAGVCFVVLVSGMLWYFYGIIVSTSR